MVATPLPADEERRLDILREYEILDTAAEKVFDDITAVAAQVCRTPIALLGFMDRDRQWFKSTVGMDVRESNRSLSMCAHAIMHNEIFLVPDAAADARFADNPMVKGEPYIRFYAGMPLVTPEGCAIGTLCVIDKVPHELEQQQLDKLKALAHSAMMLLEVRRSHPS